MGRNSSEMMLETDVVILRQLDLKYDTLKLSLLSMKPGSCTQNTSRKSPRQQVDARLRWVIVVVYYLNLEGS